MENGERRLPQGTVGRGSPGTQLVQDHLERQAHSLPMWSNNMVIQETVSPSYKIRLSM